MVYMPPSQWRNRDSGLINRCTLDLKQAWQHNLFAITLAKHDQP